MSFQPRDNNNQRQRSGQGRGQGRFRRRRNNNGQGGQNGNRGGGFHPNHRFGGQNQQPRQQAPNPHAETERRFFAGISVDPAPRIRLETGLPEATVRAIDLLCPIGRGQRGLIVSPPKSGKTTILKHLATAITKADPQVKVYCLLVDERPEEVTDFRRSVPAEVHFSSSDQPYENHIRVADELMKKAVSEAADGKHVMVLIDSLTRLARVHNSAVRGGGRTLSGGVDAQGLIIPRKIFGSARNVENGGSLGILATILVNTGSRMDDVIFQEFKGTGNMELVLSRDAAERRIFPAINIRETGTRKEELLYDEREAKAVRILRSAMAGMDPLQASQTLVDLLSKYPTNNLLLSSLQ